MSATVDNAELIEHLLSDACMFSDRKAVADALSSQSLSLSEAREEVERLRGLLNANGKPRFNEAMRRLEAAEHEARVHSDAADGYRDKLLSLRSSLRKGAETPCPHAPTYDGGLCCSHPDDCNFVQEGDR